MKILVIGAGAVGGYFGGRLAQAGRDVTFLVRDRRAAQLKDGLRLLSPFGNATIQPKLLTAAQLRTEPQIFDMVLLGTKAYSFAAAVEDFAPAVGPRTAVIPLLNGMRHLDDLAERFGQERIFGGSVRIIGDLTEAGEVEQKTELGELSFGLRPEQMQQEQSHLGFDVKVMHEVLTAPGMVTLLQPDVLATMWQKWWILASMNGICLLAGGSLGEAVSQPFGESFGRSVLDECLNIALRNSYPPDPKYLREHLDRIEDRNCPLTTSMFRDMSRGLPVEADHVLGDLLARAKGVSAPRLEAAYVRLKVYEAQRVNGV